MLIWMNVKTTWGPSLRPELAGMALGKGLPLQAQVPHR